MKRTMVMAFAGTLTLAAPARIGPPAPATAPLEIIARAGNYELSSERLALLLATGKLEGSVESAALMARFWIDYHLTALAAARGDSLNDPAVVDNAMWATVDQELFQRYIDGNMRSAANVDTTGLEARYLRGEYLAAQHILIAFPDGARGKLPAVQDSVRRKAEGIRQQVTSATFNKLAEQYTDEPGGRDINGRLGVTASGTWVPEFEAAVRALKPGGITPALVKTQFGYHIIRRNLLSEVRDEYISHLGVHDTDAEMGHLLAKLSVEYQLTAKPTLASMAKRIVVDPDAWINDKTVLATSLGGDFTAGRLANSILAYPQLAGNNLRVRIENAPDSTIVRIVRDSIAGKQLIVAAARKANVTLPAAQRASIRAMFKQYVVTAYRDLHVDAKSLDPSKPQTEREQIAAARAERAIEQLLSSGGDDFVEIRVPLSAALRATYPWAVNHAGYSRLVGRAAAIRAALDSTRAQRPKR